MKILTLAQKRIQGLSSYEAQEGFSKDISVQMLSIKVKRKKNDAWGKNKVYQSVNMDFLRKGLYPSVSMALST